MFLVYLVTGLPRLCLGEAPQITSEDFIRRARTHLNGAARADFELVMLREEIRETARIGALTTLTGTSLSPGELSYRIRCDRKPTPLGPTVDLLPSWVLAPSPIHVLMRTWCRVALQESTSPFLQEWSRCEIRLAEAITGLLCQQDNLGQEAFLHEMTGGWSSTWKVIVSNLGEADLGLKNRFAWYSDVREALALPDLRDMEIRIDRLRWKMIDEISGTDQFSMDTVLGYFFKLEILEREASWSLQKGQEILDDILALTPGKLS
ncbi:MAG: DUF2764 family protein [Candidatus Schekmanbacteria bacterium]|nr:DUF2764 family protein [Candidatus Schekmanbacteria bacterium]